MKAHAHTLIVAAPWLAAAAASHAAGHPWGPVPAFAGAALAGGVALAPDMDCQGTAARSLGWPGRLLARGISWLTEHRGATHWAVVGLLAAAAVEAARRLVVDPVSFYGWTVLPDRWPFLLVLAVGFAWCEAGFAADDRPHKRRGAVTRWALGWAAAWLTLRWDPSGAAWAPWAVLAGWWGHLLGDLCTTDRWPVLAPFSWREFGGWRVVRPAPPGERVGWRERAVERVAWVACLAASVTLLGWWPAVLAAWGATVEWVAAGLAA